MNARCFGFRILALTPLWCRCLDQVLRTFVPFLWGHNTAVHLALLNLEAFQNSFGWSLHFCCTSDSRMDSGFAPNSTFKFDFNSIFLLPLNRWESFKAQDRSMWWRKISLPRSRNPGFLAQQSMHLPAGVSLPWTSDYSLVRRKRCPKQTTVVLHLSRAGCEALFISRA